MADTKSSKAITIVIKLGTSSIVDEISHEPLLSILSLIVETAVKLRKDGHRVVIVSSGAIGVALGRRGLDKRPKHLPRVQALAAIGQGKLISLWDNLFALLGQSIAQILLTRNDIADRTQYVNAQNTLNELLQMDVIPIVNENDTIAVSEIKFGDNDTLSAITAAMIHADYLFLMTDVDCLYDRNPRGNPNAKPIEVVEDIEALKADVSGKGSDVGTGGMASKITAARLATSAGVTTIITRSSNPGNIASIVRYLQSIRMSNHLSVSGMPVRVPQIQPAIENGVNGSLATHTSISPAVTPPQFPLHTRFVPSETPIRDRSFWLLHGLAPHGAIYIDSGAQRALLNKRGLLPVGIVDVEGNFAQQEAVRLVVVSRIQNASRASSSGKLWDGVPVEIGRALVNYSSAEITRIKGVKSTEITGVLGYADSEYIALRENISFFKRESRPVTPTAI